MSALLFGCARDVGSEGDGLDGSATLHEVPTQGGEVPRDADASERTKEGGCEEAPQPTPDASTEDSGAVAADGGPGDDSPMDGAHEASPAPVGDASCADGAVCGAGRCGDGCSEGEPCDDGDPCTTNDTCVAGTCTGQPRSSEPEVLFREPRFGGYLEGRNPSQGLAAVVAEDRLVFAERPHTWSAGTVLVLVAVEDGALRVLDSYHSDLEFERQIAGGLDWTRPMLGSLEPLGNQRFAFVASQDGIETFSVEGDRIVRDANLALDPFGAVYFGGAVSADGRLWLCAQGHLVAGIHEYRAEPGELAFVSRYTGQGSCRDLAANESGTTLFVSSERVDVGVAACSVENDGPVRRGTFSRSHVHLTASDTHVATIEQGNAGAIGPLVVYRTEDLGEVARLDVAGVDPLGVALHGDRLLVQRLVTEAGTCTQELALYAVADDSLDPLTTAKLTEYPCDDAIEQPTPGWPSFTGSLAVSEGWRMVFRVNADDTLEAVTGPGHGEVEALASLGGRRLAVIGRRTAQIYDLGDSRRPAIIDSRLLPPRTSRLRIGQMADEDPALLTTALERGSPSGVAQPDEAASTTWLLEGDGGIQVGAMATLEGGPASLQTSDGWLYQVSLPDDDHVHVSRYPARVPAESTLEPTQSWTLPLPDTAPRTRTDSPSIAIQGGRAFVTAARRVPGEFQDSLMLSAWFALEDDAAPLLASAENLGPEYASVALSGGRALQVGSRRAAVVVIADDEATLEIEADYEYPDRWSSVGRILAWDGRQAVLGVTLSELNEAGLRVAVVVLDMSKAEPTVLAEFGMSDVPLTYSVVGDVLAFGGPRELVIASPACSP